jgi:predicted ATPase
MMAYRSTGATVWITAYLSCLALAYADLGKFDDAWRCIGEALTVAATTKERWYEAEINRVAGEIALQAPERDATKAEAYFERALEISRKQQAKSWELRAATSMARLWRDQGKRDEARDLLAPVYGWFTEGFDTLDLKEAKALLDELAKPHQIKTLNTRDACSPRFVGPSGSPAESCRRKKSRSRQAPNTRLQKGLLPSTTSGMVLWRPASIRLGGRQ